MINKKLTCVFAHYNKRQQVEDFVFFYLDSLKKAGFHILFISNSSLETVFQEKLMSTIPDIQIYIRPNTGNDFGAWKWAIDNKTIEDSDFLLFTNDSVFGPLFDLGPLFTGIFNDKETDFWGLTDSYQNGWHLQSYFILFRRSVFHSTAFSQIFSADFGTLKKKEIIIKGEIALTKLLTDAGFKAKAIFPYTWMDKETSKATTYNATHYYWDILIGHYRFPFVKKELITHNPENLKNVGEALHFIERHSSYPVALIKKFIVNNNSISRNTDADLSIAVICHLYYPQTIYYFLSRLSVLKYYPVKFFFNISDQLNRDKHFLDILANSFPDADILSTPNQGRDIGGKLACINSMLYQAAASDYSLIIHDKLSPHTPLGIAWRDQLLRVIDEKTLPAIFRKFEKEDKTGIIAVADFIQNEYNPDKNNFTCTSSANLLHYIKEYDLKADNYNFVAGTIFWVRTEIIQRFFTAYHPLQIRASLEKGNVLDFANGTNIHAWERVFSLMAAKYDYRISGI